MFSEPFIIKLSSTPSRLFLFFLVLLVLFDIILVRWLRISRLTWKRIEYIWLGAAALGLLGASTQAGRFVGSNYLKNTNAEAALFSAYEDLRACISR